MTTVLCQVASVCLTLRPCEPYSRQAPLSWDSAGKNTGMGCHALPQGIFPTQGSNLCLPHCGRTLYHRSQQGRSNMTATATRNGFAREVIAGSHTLGALPPPAHIPELTQPSGSRQSQSRDSAPFSTLPEKKAREGGRISRSKALKKKKTKKACGAARRAPTPVPGKARPGRGPGPLTLELHRGSCSRAPTGRAPGAASPF